MPIIVSRSAPRIGPVALAALVTVAVALAACSPRRGNPLRSATGLASHTVCAAAFVQGLDADQVYAEAVRPVPGMEWVAWALSYDIDRAHREVRARIAGGFETRAVYRDGAGCLIVRTPDDATPTPLVLPAVGTAAPLGPQEPVEPRQPEFKAALDEAFAEPEGKHVRQVKAILVVHNGKLIAERYAPGIGIDTPLPGWSMSKSVTSALIGILVRQGRLTVSQPAPVTSWSAPDDPRHAITVDMLLRQTSGLALEETGSGFDPNSRMLFRERDMAGFAERAPLDSPPGTQWRYMSGNAQILSRIVRDAAGGDAQSTLNFAWRELFAPVGMRSMTVEFDAAGTPVGSTYSYATARDWARFGQLYLNDGVVGGWRILPEGWVNYSASPTPGAQFGYGAGWWTNRGDSRGARARVAAGMPADSFFASGSLGQRIVVIPSERLVIVRLALTQMWPDFDIRGLEQLTKHVIEAVHVASRGSQARNP